MSSPIIYRDAKEDDLLGINELYNGYVARSDCTLQTEPGTLEERAAWYRGQGGLPVLVAEQEGKLAGWGALVPFSPRRGYRFTVEDSVYVDPGYLGRGVGKALLTELLSRGKALGLHTVIGRITATQAVSLALHTRLGFQEVGRLTEAGFKFDRWVDVVLVQRRF